MTASHELRVRQERIFALLAEKKRRERLGIELDDNRVWRDRATNNVVTDAEIVHREVNELRHQIKNDVSTRVIVDHAWLKSVLGEEEYSKGLASRKIMSLEAWL